MDKLKKTEKGIGSHDIYYELLKSASYVATHHRIVEQTITCSRSIS